MIPDRDFIWGPFFLALCGSIIMPRTGSTVCSDKPQRDALEFSSDFPVDT
jgi:hypothetical protein